MTAGNVGKTRVRLVKPQTYMNLSGGALRPYLRREGFSAARDLLVVVDEVQLPVGSFRIRARGSNGGHNGLKSIEAAVGSQDYARLRIGVGPEDPRHRRDLADYVLGDFRKREAKVVKTLMPMLTELVETWVKEGAETAMNRFNKLGKAGGAE